MSQEAQPTSAPGEQSQRRILPPDLNIKVAEGQLSLAQAFGILDTRKATPRPAITPVTPTAQASEQTQAAAPQDFQAEELRRRQTHAEELAQRTPARTFLKGGVPLRGIAARLTQGARDEYQKLNDRLGGKKTEAQQQKPARTAEEEERDQRFREIVKNSQPNTPAEPAVAANDAVEPVTPAAEPAPAVVAEPEPPTPEPVAAEPTPEPTAVAPAEPTPTVESTPEPAPPTPATESTAAMESAAGIAKDAAEFDRLMTEGGYDNAIAMISREDVAEASLDLLSVFQGRLQRIVEEAPDGMAKIAAAYRLVDVLYAIDPDDTVTIGEARDLAYLIQKDVEGRLTQPSGAPTPEPATPSEAAEVIDEKTKEIVEDLADDPPVDLGANIEIPDVEVVARPGEVSNKLTDVELDEIADKMDSANPNSLSRLTATLRRAAAADPENTYPLMLLAQALEKQGMEEEANQVGKKVGEIMKTRIETNGH